MKNVKRNVIVSAFMVIALCMSVVAGATFALFTSNSSVNIAITSGNVQVTATASDLVVYSPKSVNETEIVDKTDISDNTNEVKVFGNGGTATLTGGKVELNDMTPGDKATFKITVKNESTVAVKYRTVIEADYNGLLAALEISIGGKTVVGASEWQKLEAKAEIPDAEKACVIELPVKTNGDYKGKSCTLTFKVEATQGNTLVDYPDGITEDTFEQAFEDGNVSYSDHYGTHNDQPAVAAYVNADGETKYVADLREAILSGATTIYCRKDVKIAAALSNALGHPNRTEELDHDVTIYANGADFGYGEIAFNSGVSGYSDSVAKDKSFTLKVYDAKNLRIWGNTAAEGATQNIILNNCTYEGLSATDTAHDAIFLWFGGQGKMNVELNNCKISKVSAGIYFGGNGSLTIRNSSFKECATGIKASIEANDLREDIIENTSFVKCGCTTEMAEAAGSSYLATDGAALRYKKKGNATVKLTLKNVVITDTIGANGDTIMVDVTPVIE